jgi:chitinase
MNLLLSLIYRASCLTLLGLLLFQPFSTFAQAPDPALIGYFHNWNTSNAPYVPLDQVDPRYNVIHVAFAIPKAGTDYDMEFVPSRESPATFISQIQTLQAQGRKVLISMGGGNHPVSLDDVTERDTFIASMTRIIDTYGFDGIDIDFEGSSLSVSGGTIDMPIDDPVINLIYAIRKIMEIHHQGHGRRLLLTMAPETAFVQGGQSKYDGVWGAYLPLIDALRDSIEILHVQLYNSGSMYGIDRGIYYQGTADFIVSQCEAVIQGFPTNGGYFMGLPANKIAVGLPACSRAAGGGLVDPATTKAALQYLMGYGPPAGSYRLYDPNGYPYLRGMMTWSLTWDAATSCATRYQYADTFWEIFGPPTALGPDLPEEGALQVFPNPSQGQVTIRIEGNGNVPTPIQVLNGMGQVVFTTTLRGQEENLDLTHLPAGLYHLIMGEQRSRLVKL